MKKETTLIIAAALALILAVGLFIRLTMQSSNFNRVVREALKTSEGYDQKLINTVNRLEEELATRASFGYQGGKDPMTGKTRMVVMPQKAPQVKKTVTQGPVTAAPVVVDPIKLTAIIYDDEQRKYTAVVMDGERSFSVEVGDKVRDRKITQITDQMIFMEDDAIFYVYDIHGKSKTKNKL